MFDEEQHSNNAERDFENTIRKAIEGSDLQERVEGLMYFVRKFSNDPAMQAEVVPYALAAADVYEALNRPMEQFAALWSAADSYRFQNKTLECLEVCRKAYQLAKENFANKEQAHMLNNMALANLDLGVVDEAILMAGASAEIWTNELESLEAAKAFALEAKAYQEKKDYVNACLSLDKSIAGFKEGDAHYRLIDSLSRKTDTLIALGNWDEALVSHDLCVAHQQLLQQEFQKIPILFNEARLQAFKKNHVASLEMLDKVMEHWRGQNNLGKVAIVAIERSKCLYALGKNSEATSELKAVLLVSEGNKFPINRDEVQHQLSLIEEKAA